MVKFVGSYSKQDKLTFTHETIVNIYTGYKLSFSYQRYDDYSTLENCLFGAVKLTKTGIINCMFLSCHVRVSEWIYTL